MLMFRIAAGRFSEIKIECDPPQKVRVIPDGMGAEAHHLPVQDLIPCKQLTVLVA